MRLSRRELVHLGMAAATLPIAPRVARAQAYPTRPLRFIVGFPAGGGADAIPRVMGQWLADRLGQPVVVENRPGGGTNISVQAVATSPPDGYTLLFLGASAPINVTFYPSLPYNLLRDITPVAMLGDFPFVMVVHPSVPAKTVAEFITYAKANPGKISMGSFGTGTISHVAGELFKMMTGVDLLHVPYRGSAPLVLDLISNRVQVAFDVVTTSLPHIRSGALQALAMADAPFDGLPGLPTVGATVPGYQASVWAGVGVASGTPDEIVDRLSREINAGLADPAVKARFADVGITPRPYARADYARHVAAEVEKWAKVVKFSGAKAD